MTSVTSHQKYLHSSSITMTTKGAKGTLRLESEIEKHRDDNNWKKVLELADQLRTKPPRPQTDAAGLEILTNFLIGESKLEQYLEENPPTEQNVGKARNNLADAKRFLLAAMSGQSSRLGILQETYLLLGKLHFTMGFHEEAINNLQSAGLDALVEKTLAHRTLNIVAESFAIRALCLEKVPVPSTSKTKIAEREEQIMRCLETAGDLALLYLQEKDRLRGQSTLSIVSSTSGSTSPMPSSDDSRVGPILETALQRAPILHIKNGKLNRAIVQYRNILSSVETSTTQSLRLTLARQLAEVLLRGVSESSYSKPDFPVDLVGNRTGTGGRSSSSSDSPWKPKKYVGQNLFLPKDENEEIFLLLLICETMAVREAVLSRSPDHKDARLHSLFNATAIYDLMTIALVRRGQPAILGESLDRALKFSFEEFHIWFQFGLSLSCSGKHGRSVLILKECARMEPTNALPSLMAAKICYEQLEDIEEGLRFSREAVEREKSNSQGLAARCHLAVGLGLFLKSEQKHLKSEKEGLLRGAYEAFHKSQQLDPNDYLAEYYLALYYAQIRQIPEGIQHVKIALQLRYEHANSLLLLVLLLSAQKQYDEALQLVEAAREEYPDNFNLLYIKAHLEEHVCGGEEALLTSKQMLRLWRTVYEEQTQREINTGDRGRRGAVSNNVFQLYSSEVSERDSSSLRAHSVAASLVEHALSEVASSMSSYHPRPGPQQAWVLQIQIWLLLARLYLKLDQLSEANACIQEASAIFPLSHHIMFMRGLIYEHKSLFVEARKWYQNAVAINPTHVKSLQHLGLVSHYLGSNHVAEKTLRDAVKIDPLSHKCWYNMGKVLEAMSDYDSASKCLSTAIELEATCPILPFSTIPKCLD